MQHWPSRPILSLDVSRLTLHGIAIPVPAECLQNASIYSGYSGIHPTMFLHSSSQPP